MRRAGRFPLKSEIRPQWMHYRFRSVLPSAKTLGRVPYPISSTRSSVLSSESFVPRRPVRFPAPLVQGRISLGRPTERTDLVRVVAQEVRRSLGCEGAQLVQGHNPDFQTQLMRHPRPNLEVARHPTSKWLDTCNALTK